MIQQIEKWTTEAKGNFVEVKVEIDGDLLTIQTIVGPLVVSTVNVIVKPKSTI
jgi:hypothetical protein